MSLGTAGKTYPRIWKHVYDREHYAVVASRGESNFYLGRHTYATFNESSLDNLLAERWAPKEIPCDQYRRELYRKVFYRRRRVSKASKFDEKLFDACIKLCNEHFFWNKDYNTATHSMQFLHQKTGATFDVSANEFITCPNPQAALELVETHHAIYNVTESGK